MRKSTLSSAVAVLVLLALTLTGCPNAATVQPEGSKPTPPATGGTTTTQKIEAVSTTGSWTPAQKAADGSATLTTTDSNGGTYTFTQPVAPAASVRSASSTGGTWSYTNSKGVKQFEGSYTGDITSSSAGSLNLTVEKAADASGKMLEVTEPQRFDFTVSNEGTFSATIPAVEIVVSSASTIPSIIKTVTATSSDPSNRMSFTQTINFYSNKTFKLYISGQYDVGLSWREEGIAMTGFYTGNPLTDGQIVLNVEKNNTDLIAGTIGLNKAKEAYIQGKDSISVTATETDLFPLIWNMGISISGNTFTSIQDFPHNYTKNDDGSTTFTVNAIGDDTSSVCMSYAPVLFRDDGGWSSTGEGTSKGSFSQRIPITNATENTGVSLTVFIDKDGDGTCTSADVESEDLTSIRLKPGHHIEVNLDIRKLSIPFKVEGDTTQYQNIHVGNISNSVPWTDGKIEVLFASRQNSGSLQHLRLDAIEMPSGAGSSTRISDTAEYYLWKDTPPSLVIFKLYNKLDEGKKIRIETYPTDNNTFTDEDKKHFRFHQETGDNIIFYIPIGSGTDGEFIQKECCTNSPCSGNAVASTHFGTLLEIITHGHVFHLFDTQNYNAQLDKLYEDMGNIVRVLENRWHITVHGKELIGL